MGSNQGHPDAPATKSSFTFSRLLIDNFRGHIDFMSFNFFAKTRTQMYILEVCQHIPCNVLKSDFHPLFFLIYFNKKIIAYSNIFQVGFAIFEIVATNTMVTMAARTRKSYRGKGIATKLYQSAVRWYINQHGSPLCELRVAYLTESLEEKLQQNLNWSLERKWVSFKNKCSLIKYQTE